MKKGGRTASGVAETRGKKKKVVRKAYEGASTVKKKNRKRRFFGHKGQITGGLFKK